MSKYIKQDDVFELVRKGVLISNSNFESVCKHIGSLPTIDIVTCDECKRWVGDSEWYKNREYRRCQNGGLLTSLNHYCAWGERMEE